MTDRYGDIYDIDFFNGRTYNTVVGPSSVTIHAPGLPDWASTYKGLCTSPKERGSAVQFLQFQYQRVWGTENIDYLQDSGPLQPADILLLALVLCENAYRKRYDDLFLQLNAYLANAAIPDIQLKAAKLAKAWHALEWLAPPQANLPPLDVIKNQAFDYVKARREVSGTSYTAGDIMVETRVRRDWIRRGASIESAQDRDAFYRETLSYILELTAANHQVDTLFNYMTVIDLLLEKGVKRIFDYGAGIGTFAALAQRAGMKVTLADISSNTTEFATFRLNSLGIPHTHMTLTPDFKLPQGLDCIVCTEVLEHIEDPNQLITDMQTALRPKGFLVVSESFDHVKAFCTHLPKHKGKGGDRFIADMKQRGWVHLPTSTSIPITVHLRP